jgi:hypothetical protein
MERLLVWMGLGIAAVGLLIAAVGALMGLVGGRGARLLPGDIVVSRPGFTFVFPLATSLVLSLVLTLILVLIGAWRR